MDGVDGEMLQPRTQINKRVLPLLKYCGYTYAAGSQNSIDIGK